MADIRFIPSVDVVKAAQQYIDRGWAPVPVPFGEKGPKKNDWQNFRTDTSRVAREFTQNNIGIILGKASQNLHDIDLDCEEAIRLAPFFLPVTKLIAGHTNRPQSHYFYATPAPIRYQKLTDPNIVEKGARKVLIECRGDGHQTLVQPSQHPSGASYVWYEYGDPGIVTDLEDFENRFLALGAGCLLVRYWKEGVRHDIANALVAVLYRKGWPVERIQFLINAVAETAGDNVDERLRCIPYTIEKLQQIAEGDGDVKVTGWPTLQKTLGQLTCTTISKWLHLDNDKPVITITTDLQKMRLEALKALATDKEIFVRDHKLVYIVKQKTDDLPYIANLPKPALKEKMATVAEWQKPKKPKKKDDADLFDDDEDETKPTKVTPPKDTVDAIHEWENWPGLRPLVAITETPTLLPDRRLLVEAGWDESSSILYRPLHTIPLPGAVEHADALKARDRLLNLVKDFPFPADNRDVYQSAWLSLLITPFVRHSFGAASTPLFAIDANSPAAGKTLLTRITCTLAYGRKPPVTGWPCEEEERRKLITSCLSSGYPMIFLDNVATPLNGTALNRLLTNPIWQDRILGLSRTTTLPVHAIMLATGNNLQFGTETIRRTIHIRLESNEENPQERTDFERPDIETYVAQERVSLVRDVLTIVSAYEKSGRPRVILTAMGSFEEWSYVRQMLQWIGMKDPLLSQKALNENNNGERSELMALIAGVEEITRAGPLTAAEMIGLVGKRDFVEAVVDGNRETKTISKAAALESALQEYSIGKTPGAPSPRDLAARLKMYLHRVCHGKMIACARPDRTGAARWLVKPATIYSSK